MTRWIDPVPVRVPASFAELHLPPLIAETLVRRGIDTPEAARAFLHPDSQPSVPFPGIEPAVERIQAAIRNRERICVWGDFDVDGQTSTTVLVQTFQAIGGDVVYYIPVRSKEGHGVHIESLRPIIDHGATLLITCDTGITAYEAIDYANSRGVDVIVTDHHDPGPGLPSARAIVNPKLLGEDHLLANLAGVGVAYKLAEVLLTAQRSPATSPMNAHALLDLVALGLISDVALLRGETRTLVQRGIQRLRNTDRIGLRTIAEMSGTSLETLTEESIGFTFAPRLNALGRLGDANPSVELLLSRDLSRARVIATQIEGFNTQRRLLTNQVYEAAEGQLRENPDLRNEPVIILANEHWPGGVLGIVANKLVERYHKPAILFNRSEDGILRGSARSVEGLHITEAIATQRERLLDFGGHPMAAGLSLEAWNLEPFRKGLRRAIENQMGRVLHEEPVLSIDAWLKLDEISPEFAQELEALAPFGAGNSALTFATRRVRLRSATTIGKNREHLRFTVEDENGNFQSILWWGGAGSPLPEEGSTFDIAYSLRASTFRGDRQVTLQFKEFRIVEEVPPELRKRKVEIVDCRQQLAAFETLSGGSLVWAEGIHKSKGKNRLELVPADELVIYTAPPSPSDLRIVLERVKPQKVYLFGVSPEPERADAFLAHLAGMAKYVINRKGGKISIAELAAATGHREGTIRLGLEWLSAGGHITIQEDEGIVVLGTGKGESNPYLRGELYLAVKGILEETIAYRTHFQSADAQSLMEWE
jgi:single-stranded-DNA-specific exonuclease